MEISVPSDAILKLGRKLTHELNLDDSVDTLGRWMAHYIAELIQDAETASEEERPVKMQACNDAILRLWQHRHVLPDGSRPFEELEPLLKTLENLDSENNSFRYFHSARKYIFDNTIDESDETKTWLKLVNGLDHSAKILIRYCLAQAAQNALNKSKEWVSLAEAAGIDNSIEFSLLRVFYEEEKILDPSHRDEKEQIQLEKHIEKLEAFIGIASSVLSELRK